MPVKQITIPKACTVIADDEAGGRDGAFIRKAVKELGYVETNVFTSSEEAVALVKSGVGNLVLVNLRNKALNGLDVIHSIKDNRLTSHVPIILTSHGGSAKEILAARQAGADGYVMKPLTTGSILSQIEGASKFRVESIIKIRKMREGEIKKRHDTLAIEQKSLKNLYAETIKRLQLEMIAFPWNYRSYAELGKMMLRIEKGGSAIIYLNSAKKLRTSAPEIYGLLAEYYLLAEDYAKSIYFLKTGLSVKFNLQALEKLGELELKNGDVNSAITTFNRIIQVVENRPETAKGREQELSRGLNRRGQAYREKGVKDNNKNLMNRAATDFKQSGDLNPDFLAAHYNLMVTYKKMGDSKSALEVFEKIKSFEPKDFDGWLQLAEAYYHDNEMAKVSFALEKGVKLRWGDLAARRHVIGLFIKYALFEKAEALLLKTLEEAPEDVYLNNHLGIIYRRKGKAGEAASCYKQALKADPDNAGIYFNLGKALMDSGNGDEAKKMFKKCLDLDPEIEEAKSYV